MATVELPMEMVMEILSWLPVKFLFQLKCISKTWLRLITYDSNFSKLHINHQLIINPNPSILYTYEQALKCTNKIRYYHRYAADYTAIDKANVYEFPGKKCYNQPYELFGICNGLLCLSNSSPENYSTVYLWNPLTSDRIAIQCSRIPSCYANRGGIGKYIVTNTLFGFGYHQGIDEYKVIRIVSSSPVQSDCPSHVSVYTLGAHSWWRTLPDISYAISFADNDQYETTALVNGALHWFATRPGTLKRDVIVSFDLKDEVFREIPQPKDINFKHKRKVREMSGLLCMPSFAYRYLHIWVLKEYGVPESWTKQHTIIRRDIPGLTGLPRICVANNGEIIICRKHGKYILYDPKTKSMKPFHSGFSSNDAHRFTGSLVSPTVITRLGQRKRKEVA
ncbi:hypothetical protein AQUCO_03700130v1 [Aquilegia coerulea]|uniref:F-box domain-containing protein n=1 Tax=Aquilegia coerulea TaxID=218851 RepID=A0A2G5CTL9_AQUCA|nr:hypothetical protein AQUCO_03700130v1 [Aquilegia coerulea]